VKQGISRRAVVVVVLIVVILVVVIGYFVFMKPKSGLGKGQWPDETQQKMRERMGQPGTAPHPGMAPEGGGTPPGGGR